MTSVEDLHEALRAADAVVLATDHSAYAGLDWSSVAGAVVNTRGPRRAGVDVEGSW
jgi:UDP-N-acetyl-D-mannosaminuronate dehydrogenase